MRRARAGGRSDQRPGLSEIAHHACRPRAFERLGGQRRAATVAGLLQLSLQVRPGGDSDALSEMVAANTARLFGDRILKAPPVGTAAVVVRSEPSSSQSAAAAVEAAAEAAVARK